MPWAAVAAYLLLVISGVCALTAMYLRFADSPLADRRLVVMLRDIAWPLTVIGFGILGMETQLFRSRAFALIVKLSRASAAERGAGPG